MEFPSTEIHGTSRILIQPGKLEDFKRLAGQCVDSVRSQDDGTVEYELFLDEERMVCFVHERYRDSGAGLKHMTNIGPMMQPMSEEGIGACHLHLRVNDASQSEP